MGQKFLSFFLSFFGVLMNVFYLEFLWGIGKVNCEIYGLLNMLGIFLFFSEEASKIDKNYGLFEVGRMIEFFYGM